MSLLSHPRLVKVLDAYFDDEGVASITSEPMHYCTLHHAVLEGWYQEQLRTNTIALLFGLEFYKVVIPLLATDKRVRTLSPKYNLCRSRFLVSEE